MTTLLCDLDGVLWRGSQVIPGAADAVALMLGSGISMVFVTNNSFTPHGDIQSRITQTVGSDDFVLVTSPLVATHYMARILGPRTGVMVVGDQSLRDHVETSGFVLAQARDDARAVLVGLNRNFGYSDLAEAHAAITNGALFLAANDDPSFPVEEGSLPGAGSIVSALERSTGRRATVLGKPNDACIRYLREQIPPEETVVVVGDRLDQDGQLAEKMGSEFFLVLTGSTTPTEAGGSSVPRTTVCRDLAEVSLLVTTGR